MDLFVSALRKDAASPAGIFPASPSSAGDAGPAAGGEPPPVHDVGQTDPAPYACPVVVRRVHHNSFLAECHRRLHAHSEAISNQLKVARSSHGRNGAADSAPGVSPLDRRI